MRQVAGGFVRKSRLNKYSSCLQSFSPRSLVPYHVGRGFPARVGASQVIVRAKQFEVRVIDQGIAILAANFASELSLRGADAIYVALAKRLDVPLITWDKELTQPASSVIAVRSPQVSTS